MNMSFSYMADGAYGGGVAIDPETSPFDDGLEIETIQEQTGPSADDVRKELDALKAANDELKIRADQSAQLSSSFNQFGERLEKVVSRPQAPVLQQQPGETTEQFKERINRKYLEDPYETMMEFSNRYVGGALQTMAQQSMQLQRKLAYLEADDKDFVRKHQEEIEQEVGRIPIDQQMRDPEAYKRAMDSVRARHMDEIIAIKVAEAIAKATGTTAPAQTQRSPLGGSETPVIPGAPASSSPAGSSSFPSSSPGARRLSLTQNQISRIQMAQKRDGLAHVPMATYVEMLQDDGIDVTKL